MSRIQIPVEEFKPLFEKHNFEFLKFLHDNGYVTKKLSSENAAVKQYLRYFCGAKFADADIFCQNNAALTPIKSNSVKKTKNLNGEEDDVFMKAVSGFFDDYLKERSKVAKRKFASRVVFVYPSSSPVGGTYFDEDFVNSDGSFKNKQLVKCKRYKIKTNKLKRFAQFGMDARRGVLSNKDVVDLLKIITQSKREDLSDKLPLANGRRPCGVVVFDNRARVLFKGRLDAMLDYLKDIDGVEEGIA